MAIRYPNESDEYRKARDELLAAEKELRAHVEEVASLRRGLPPGGEVPEDYVFDERVDGEAREVRLSELFRDGHDTLFVYGFMYAPDMKEACPMCTALLDGLDGQIRHLERRISTAVVAKHDLGAIHRHAEERGWRHFRLLSSARNGYNVDYFGEVDGQQRSMANVFRKENGVVRHFWGTDLSHEPMMEGGNMRHVDLMWPLWNVLDLTPGGRGDWYPALRYESEVSAPGK